MRVEVAHLDDEGHYATVAPHELVVLGHRFFRRVVISSVEVCRPESESLDITFRRGPLAARWSGLYFAAPVELGWLVSAKEDVKIEVKNFGPLPVFARIFLDVQERP